MGPKDPLNIVLFKKVCTFFLAISMTILKVPPKNRQIGEKLGRWPGLTKPNLPAFPNTWNIWSHFWGWSMQNFTVGSPRSPLSYALKIPCTLEQPVWVFSHFTTFTQIPTSDFVGVIQVLVSYNGSGDTECGDIIHCCDYCDGRVVNAVNERIKWSWSDR